MSTIVKIRNKKSGKVYAYEQTARWDAEKGQSRPVRKYLGRYDEETDTIIPSTGRRGPKPAEKPVDEKPPTSARGAREQATETDDLRRKYEEAVAENGRMREALSAALKSLNDAAGTIEALLGQTS